MKLSDLIKELQQLEAAGHGDLHVLVHDGFDPSDLRPISWAELGTEYFYDHGTSSTKPCIKLTP